MRTRTVVVSAMLLALTMSSARPAEKYNLKVLYVGKADSPRAREYVQFLEMHFIRATSASREGFDPAAAADVDVVLLDWPQEPVIYDARNPQGTGPAGVSVPLGARESWVKPTVLLGSAGERIAAPWKLSGGYG